MSTQQQKKPAPKKKPAAKKPTPKGPIADGQKVTFNGKKGVVVQFWPRHTTLAPAVTAEIEKGRRLFDSFRSAFNRYLIKVERKGASGTLKPAYFAPLKGVVERANPRAKRAPAS